MVRNRDFFTLKPSYLALTLTYILMNNFCACFIRICMFRCSSGNARKSRSRPVSPGKYIIHH